ncbi:hypothetical Protein YC6258_04631 [Gynuella sunshinyii YC6258]|uniref:Uncharacterized protein n=1 Tax=Gynuella sunshinyii YC6258 TaxID=1445510 RepID=A0A0C5W1W4_9GAMM|nr:hypothetical Protein YC6258_04631 [Gynuella sunshinyii YC6258]
MPFTRHLHPNRSFQGAWCWFFILISHALPRYSHWIVSVLIDTPSD